MIPYLLAILFMIGVSVCYYLTKPFKHKKILYCIALALPMVFLCSFKNLSVGNDTTGYYDYYHYYASNPIGTRHGEVEVGFGIYASILGHMKVPFTLFLLISYIIVFAPIVLLTNKYSKYPEIVMISLFLFQFLNFAISGLRQSIAIGLCLFGLYILIYNWRESKILKKIIKLAVFFVIIAVGYFFHKSSLIFVIVGVAIFSYDVIKINSVFFCLLCLLLAITSPYLYGLLFSQISTVYHYDPPSSKFFLDVGFSTYLCIAFVVLYNLSKKQDTLVLKYEEFTYKITSFIKLKEERHINNFINKASANTSCGSDNKYSDFFLMVFAIVPIINCTVNAAEVFGRVTTFYVFSLGFVLSSILERINSKRAFVITYIGFLLILAVYFYFGSYRSGYLHMFPYKVGFYS